MFVQMGFQIEYITEDTSYYEMCHFFSLSIHNFTFMLTFPIKHERHYFPSNTSKMLK